VVNIGERDGERMKAKKLKKVVGNLQKWMKLTIRVH